MANTFYIEFRYKENTFKSLVSVRPKANEYSVIAYLLDEKLLEIVPEGEVHFIISKGIRRAMEPVHISRQLLVSRIREAVIKHMNDFSGAV